MKLYFYALYSSNSYTHFVKKLKIIALEIILINTSTTIQRFS